jgi:nitroimidazol reductase NimA-like FMN-containing flavoprotein (pyridoxamine 5'-phosphate oxidase superfamily)
MSERALDDQGLEVLGAKECFELLSQEPIGRIAFVTGERPEVLPMNHAVDGDDLVLCAPAGSKADIAQHLDGVPIAYEADHYDQGSGTGWSVLIQGEVEPVTDAKEIERLESLRLTRWAEDDRERQWIRVAADHISGRRIRPSVAS